MVVPLRSLLAVGTLLVPFVAAQQVDPKLTGTWTTKSRKVVTGPGFYDPVNEKMFEPPLTGFSYSFTDDGYFEEAYYRAVSNPAEPSCPSAIIQWQHGKYKLNPDKSLTLNPIPVDGRQLQSDPCNHKYSIYTRYNQTEKIKKYEVHTDAYSQALRLDLYAFDGTPLNPMYLAYKPPQMLPTVTLNPTSSATGSATKATVKSKRSDEGLEGFTEPLNKHVMSKIGKEPIDADKWWWIGVSMTGLGGLLYYCF